MLALRKALTIAEKRLLAGPHPERARQDSELLLRAALGCEKTWLITHLDQDFALDVQERFDAMLVRRLAGEPIQYITGETEFYGLPFRVTSDVLIPRRETEHVVEKVIECAAGFRGPRIVDVGTGSGAIAVAVAHQAPQAAIKATDISEAALAVARANAERNRVADRIRFLHGDLLAPVAGERFDIVVSNPPYVPECDRGSLSIEVRDHEPAQALFAGEDGLAIYRRLIPAAFAALVPGGFIVLETGYGQEASVRALVEEAGFEDIGFATDLQGIARVASGRRR